MFILSVTALFLEVSRKLIVIIINFLQKIRANKNRQAIKMKIVKKNIDNLSRCYSAAAIKIQGETHLLFSEEAKGGRCFDYYGEEFKEKRMVWDNGGGTMSIIPLEHKEGEFLATEGFFPGFEAEKCKILWCKLKDDKWEVNDYITVPYLHRFDVFNVGDRKYLVGGVLCEKKDSREDWSSKGKIIYAELTEDYTEKPLFKEFPVRITKNHGYYKCMYKGKESCFFSGEEGVFRVWGENNSLKCEQIFEKAVSDMAFIDIDNDGFEEMITIEPFHGNSVKLYKEVNGKWEEIYEYKKPTNFAHAICSGKILGKNSFVIGIRKENKELFILQYDDEKKSLNEIQVDREVGPANAFIINRKEEDIIVSCNHTVNEAAIYTISR